MRETQDAEPVFATVEVDGAVAGHFSGLIVRRLGIRLLGSPLPGWSTAFMGFNLRDEQLRAEAIRAIFSFAFTDLGCKHVELRDRHVDFALANSLGCHVERFETYEIDLAREEEEIFAGFTSACRRAVRRAEKVGVTVEEAAPDGFAEEYYVQLEDVFAKQGLRPTYDVGRVDSLIRHLHPAGRLMLLRARDADGNGVATALFPGHGASAFFWGGASLRSGQQNRPNEAIFWHAIRAWRERGAIALDLGGGGEYKTKYGATNIFIPHMAQSRHAILWTAREWMRKRNDPDNPSGRFRAADQE